jgi:hypothetical protein
MRPADRPPRRHRAGPKGPRLHRSRSPCPMSTLSRAASAFKSTAERCGQPFLRRWLRSHGSAAGDFAVYQLLRQDGRARFRRTGAVHQSGYNAEFRASIGGIVNAITRTEAIHGAACWGYYTPNGLQGARRCSSCGPPTRGSPNTSRSRLGDPARVAHRTRWTGDPRSPLAGTATDNQLGVTRRTVTFQSNGQRGTFELNSSIAPV